MSIMQLLLNRACKLPMLLERFYGISHLSDPSNLHTIERLWHDFRALLVSLREWEQKAKSQGSHPLVWSTSDPKTWSSSSTGAVWFPNLMVANSLTHYWAFEIIVRMHLSTLQQIISTAKGYDLQTPMHAYTEASEEFSLLTLADMICDSTSYLLQPGFKFHGLGSAFFTLPTALRVFGQEQDLSKSRIERCEQITGLLASREIPFTCDR